jgi:hypothetical protein
MKFVDIFTALYDYNSQHEEELTFKADDTLYILENDDSDWYKAQLKPKSAGEDGLIGLVPANYVQRVSIFFFFFQRKNGCVVRRIYVTNNRVCLITLG